MGIFRTCSRVLAWPLIVLFLVIAAPVAPAQAAFIGTEDVVQRHGGLADRDKVAHFLQRQDVRQQLASLGVDPREVEARVAALSDREIAQIAGKIDQMPAGQGLVGTLIVATLIIFLVLLLTDILGFTHVFTFVSHKR